MPFWTNKSRTCVSTNKKRPLPVVAADDDGLPAGAAHGAGELVLVVVPAVVELLEDAALAPVRDDALITAADHDRVGRPGQCVRRTRVREYFTLKQTSVIVLRLNFCEPQETKASFALKVIPRAITKSTRGWNLLSRSLSLSWTGRQQQEAFLSFLCSSIGSRMLASVPLRSTNCYWHFSLKSLLLLCVGSPLFSKWTSQLNSRTRETRNKGENKSPTCDSPDPSSSKKKRTTEPSAWPDRMPFPDVLCARKISCTSVAEKQQCRVLITGRNSFAIRKI